MATQLFIRGTTTNVGTGTQDTFVTNSAGWSHRALSTSRGSSVTTINTSTVAGPTAGIIAGSQTRYFSEPVSSAFTLSGTITANLWASEFSMTDNGAININVQVLRAATGTLDTIGTTARTTEVAVTTPAVNNFTLTPTSTSILEGDRLVVIVWFDDSTANMSAGGTLTFSYDSPTASVDGDSYVSFTETFGFHTTDPTGTTLYPTNANTTAVAGSNLKKEMWASPDAGSAFYITTLLASWQSPSQITDSAGGTTVDWFSRALNGFTLSGPVKVGYSVTGSGGGSLRYRISIVDSAGTVITDWAEGTTVGTGNGSFLTAGPSTVVSAGNFIRMRYFVDDSAASNGTGNVQLVVSSSAATYLILTQTISEYTPPVSPPWGLYKRRLNRAIVAS